jgi:hypothetical protein
MTTQPQLEVAASPLPIRVVGSTINNPNNTVAVTSPADVSTKRWAGLVDREYRIPWRSSRLEPLTLDVIKGYVDQFAAFAAERPEQPFTIVPFGNYAVGELAKLFAGMPANCAFPGVWQTHLGSESSLRLFIQDPEMRLREKAGQMAFQQLLNRLRADIQQGIELVSLRDRVAEKIHALTARLVGAKHIIIERVSPAARASGAVSAEAQAIWYSTHLVLVSARTASTTSSAPVRLLGMAAREGLEIIDISGNE